MKKLKVALNYVGTVIEAELRVPDEVVASAHSLRRFKDLLETNAKVLNTDFDVTEDEHCPNCMKFAELFAQAATCATEAGAVVRSLLRTLNDLEITRQVEAAEKLLAQAQPPNHWVN